MVLPRRRLLSSRRLVAVIAIAAIGSGAMQASLSWRAPPPEVEGWAGTARFAVLSPLLVLLRSVGAAWRGPCVARVDGGRAAAAARADEEWLTVVTGSNRVLRQYEDMCVERLAAYARRHGHAFRDVSRLMDKDRLPSHTWFHWGKVQALRDVLAEGYGPERGWVAWFDTDVLVMNEDVRLTDVIEPFYGDETVAVVLATDEGINTGAMLWQRGPRARQLADDWWEFAPRPGYDNDQHGLRAIYNERVRRGHGPPGVPAVGFRVLRQCSINSTPLLSLEQETYFDGDFLLHPYSLSSGRKQRCLEMASLGYLPDAGCV